jgi:2-polyprenyl-3-methyl-5-hydroxy-6-metoxy-1,4-benzoquinol methylase
MTESGNLSDRIRAKVDQLQQADRESVPELDDFSVTPDIRKLNPDTDREAFSEIRRNYESLLELINNTYVTDREILDDNQLNQAIEQLNKLVNSGIPIDSSRGLKSRIRAVVRRILRFGLAQDLDQHSIFMANTVQILNAVNHLLHVFSTRQRELNAVIARFSLALVPVVDEKIRYAYDTLNQIIIANVRILSETFNRHTRLLVDRMDILHQGLDRRQSDVLTWLKNTDRDLQAVLCEYKKLEKETIRALSLQFKKIEENSRQITNDTTKKDLIEKTDTILDDYSYYLFEREGRGSEDSIRESQSFYLKIFEGRSPVLDIGCGRGEFLELLRGLGIASKGIDSNSAMVHTCREKKLDVEAADAFAFLAGSPEQGWAGIFSAQVVEHLPRHKLSTFFSLAYKVLKPEGVICVETINTSSPYAYFHYYHRDLTHQMPVHPETYRFLLETNGFTQVTIDYRSPSMALLKKESGAMESETEPLKSLQHQIHSLNQFVFAPCDIVITGYKPGSEVA